MRIINPRQGIIPERSTMVTFIGVLMGVFAVIGLLNNLGAFILFGFNFDATQMVGSFSKLGIKSDWLTPEKLRSLLISFTAISTIIDVVCLLAALGLVKRKSWARTYYQLYFALLICRDIALIGLVAASNIFGKGLAETQNTNSSMLMILNIVLGIITVNGMFYVYAFFKLSSKRTKREFQPAWMR